MVAFQGKAEAAGAIVVLRNRVCPAGSALTGSTSRLAETNRPPFTVAASSMEPGPMRPARSDPDVEWISQVDCLVDPGMC